MKLRPTLTFFRPANAVRSGSSATKTSAYAADDLPVPRSVARRILISLLFPAMLMPLASAMADVALPAIRDEFVIRADMTAWVATAFTLPFMVLMAVYGRLSDGVGKRRLILAGLVLFTIGTLMTLSASNLAWLMIGRAIQGIGTSGLIPLGIAFISSIFHPKERGEALGVWSAVGPMVGFVAPVIAGFIVEHWGWRIAFAPPLFLSLITIVVVVRFVPPGLSAVVPRFWRRFDWIGVILFTGSVTLLLFYISSQPITGVEPLRDWRLLGGTVILCGAFIWWERRHKAPFVPFSVFRNSAFTRSSFVASARMVVMAGSSFLLPLYLTDVRALNASTIGLMLMVTPGTMMLVVRQGGRMADLWGSRTPIVAGAIGQGLTMLLLSQLSASAPLWHLAALFAFYGLGVGLMLASLHHAAMSGVSDNDMGTAAGLYSMVRFAGSTIGTAIIGVLLQYSFDRGLPAIEAYQRVYLVLSAVSVLGLLVGIGLKEQKRIEGEMV